MKRPLALLTLGLALLWAQAALATITTPAAISTLHVGVASGSSFSTTADAPPGSTITVIVIDWGSPNASFTGCSLSSGDTLTQATTSPATATVYTTAIYEAVNTAHDLPSGGTITCTTTGAVTWAGIAYSMQNATAGLDKTNSIANASNATTLSIATGTLSTTNEVVVAATITSGTNFGTWTESSGFTNLINTPADATAVGYQRTPTTTSITYAPSWSTSSKSAGVLASFQPTSGLNSVSLGVDNSGAASTNVLTTTQDCPAGSLIVAFATVLTVADTLSSVTDAKSNTYGSPFDTLAGTGIGTGFATAVNTTTDVPSGTQITAHFSGSTQSTFGALCIQNALTVNPLDTSNHASAGLAATSATTVNTGALAVSNEIIVGGFGTATTMNSPVCGSGYLLMTSGTGISPGLALCSQVVSSTASVAFSPSWTGANNYVSDVISFKGLGGAAALTHFLTTLGVGG